MRCYLMRHGQAAAGPDDAARPLTPTGRAAVEATAGELATRGVTVVEIRHSGLRRARETAEILARVLDPRGGIHRVAGLAPDDNPDVASTALDAAEAPVMLVGHLPHLARLVARLLRESTGASVVSFNPATAVCLARMDETWAVEWLVEGTPPERPG